MFNGISCSEELAMDERIYNKLSTEEERVFVYKGTEPPFRFVKSVKLIVLTILTLSAGH
jgi:hypothetical protein